MTVEVFRTESLPTMSLVLGIIGLIVSFSAVIPGLAILLGMMGRSQSSKKTGWGIGLGIVGLVLTVAEIALVDS